MSAGGQPAGISLGARAALFLPQMEKISTGISESGAPQRAELALPRRGAAQREARGSGGRSSRSHRVGLGPRSGCGGAGGRGRRREAAAGSRGRSGTVCEAVDTRALLEALGVGVGATGVPCRVRGGPGTQTWGGQGTVPPLPCTEQRVLLLETHLKSMNSSSFPFGFFFLFLLFFPPPARMPAVDDHGRRGGDL